MKKNYLKIYFFIALVSSLLFINTKSSTLFAQDADTTTAVRMVTSLIAADSLYMELRLQRLNTNWQRWANGSFIFGFSDTTLTIDTSKFEFKLIARKGLISDSAADPNFDKYTVKTSVLPGRFSIQIKGPEVYDEAIDVPYVKMDSEDTLLTYTILGTFLIRRKDTKPFIVVSNDTTVTFRLLWKRPIDYYQASSYKTNTNIEQYNKADYFDLDDNVELYQPFQNAVMMFYDDNTPKPRTILRFVDAIYEGAKKISIHWVTRQEAYVKGWAIYRGRAPYGTFDMHQVAYSTQVASNLTSPEDTRLMGIGTKPFGKAYMYEYDTVDIKRGENYCYELKYIDFNNNIIDIPNARVCVNIPNSVLSFAKAYPNPVERSTQVSYNLEDDATVSIKLYDVTGKLIKTIAEDLYVKQGRHVFDLEIPELAMQGMYDLLINADPVEDETVERSFTVIKLQVVR